MASTTKLGVTDLERREAVKWLMNNNISSISPQTGILLLRIQKQITELPYTERVPDAVVLYAATLKFVCDIVVLHQGAVIAKLDSLVKENNAG